MSNHSSHLLTDHEEIRKWAEERGAVPTKVKGTGSKNDTGLLRLDFPGYSGEGVLEDVTWEQFFEQMEKNDLALLVQEETKSGDKSRFNKLVKRPK